MELVSFKSQVFFPLLGFTNYPLPSVETISMGNSKSTVFDNYKSKASKVLDHSKAVHTPRPAIRSAAKTTRAVSKHQTAKVRIRMAFAQSFRAGMFPLVGPSTHCQYLGFQSWIMKLKLNITSSDPEIRPEIEINIKTTPAESAKHSAQEVWRHVPACCCQQWK